MRFGAEAVRLVERREFGRMVAFVPPDVKSVPLADVIGKTKLVPVDGDIVRTAREMGICMGD
ncbi:Pyrophosphate--fructose 6-phosphate 1-phosphotransferase [compost metagenome]